MSDRAQFARLNGAEIYYEYDRHPHSSETFVLIHGFLSSTFSFRQLHPLLNWHLIGYLGTIVSFIILSFYSVVGGWILSYRSGRCHHSIPPIDEKGGGHAFPAAS